jgi:imidazolonepropionase-like amidohydrolase
LATERAGTPETDPLKRTFTDEEIVAIVDEATKAGIPVAAHAHADEGAYAAVKAGVRSIEHGTFLSDKTLALMKSKGTYYVPTFSVRDQRPADPKNVNNPILEERKKSFLPHLMEVTMKAYKMGILVVCGTDTRYSEPGHTMADEALYLQKAGMPAMDIIKAMTSTSAKCLGIYDRTGSIKKGMEADIVILRQSPLKDLSALHDILMVVNNGQIVVTLTQTSLD